MMTALSPRQVEIMSLLANGQTTKQIGMRMKLSPRTIKRSLIAAKECLNAETREHLVALAVEARLVKVITTSRAEIRLTTRSTNNDKVVYNPI